MAGIVPTFQKLNLLLAKAQTTLGTAIGSLASPTNFITVDDNFELTYKKDFAEQSLVQGIFGQAQRVAGMSMFDAKVSLGIIPTGAVTEPVIKPFLDACGTIYVLATKKHSWTPTSVVAANWKDLEMWSYTGDATSGDSILSKAHSCMFDVEFAGEVGKVVTATFTGKGVPVAVPAAGTYPTVPTIITTVPPAVLKNTTMTINGLTLNILKFSVKMGNDVQLIKSPADESGYLQSMIVGRKSTWSVTVYMQDASTNNPQSLMAAGTLGTTTIKFGASTDNLISFTSGASKSEIIDCKQSSDNGLMTWDITGNYVDNNFTIAINDA